MIKKFMVLLLVISICIINIGCSRTKTTYKEIYESDMVEIGGIKQFISIRGKDSKNPIILFLHGGPGSAQSSFAYKYQDKLEENFIVVNWDQRGAGKSYSEDIPKESMTIEQFVSDTSEVVDYLLKRFNKEKMYLVGHSWGSILGMKTVKYIPEKIYAYIGIGQAVNMQEGEIISYEAVLSEAKKRNNEIAIRELGKIGEPPYKNVSNIAIERKWLAEFGFSYRNVSLNALLMESLEKDELDKYQKGTMFSINNLLSQVMEVNLFEEIKEVEAPIYFCLGKYDYQTPTEISKKYFEAIEASHKTLIWFNESAHSPNFDEPDKFNQVMIDIYKETFKK